MLNDSGIELKVWSTLTLYGQGTESVLIKKGQEDKGTRTPVMLTDLSSLRTFN